MALGAVLLVLFALSHAGTALVVEARPSSPDAIVSLASHEWERLPQTAALAKRFPASTVLLTVPARASQKNCHLCAERPNWLVNLGVEGRRIRLLPNRASNTWDEASAALVYSRENEVRELVIVTSPYHTRRALATFRKVFASTPTRIAIEPASHTQADPTWWWRHSFDRWYVTYEWAGSVAYLFRHHVCAFC